MEARAKYFEDFAVGEQFQSASRTLTDAHSLMFAAVSGDNHPIHYDEVLAAEQPFGRPVVHGLLLAAMTALGATEISLRVATTMVAFLEQSTRFKRPAFVGDTITPVTTVIEVARKTNGKGVVRTSVALMNQRGEEILEGAHAYLIRTRDS